MPFACTGTGKESATKSSVAHPPPGNLDSFRGLILCRDLAESLDRIDELKSGNQTLLTALRSLAGSDDFDAARHNDIVELLSKVCLSPTSICRLC